MMTGVNVGGSCVSMMQLVEVTMVMVMLRNCNLIVNSYNIVK